MQQQQQHQKVGRPLCKWFLLEAESHPPPILMGMLQRDSGPAAGRERLLFSPSVKSARFLLLIITTSYFAFRSFVSFYSSVHLPFHLLHPYTRVHEYREKPAAVKSAHCLLPLILAQLLLPGTVNQVAIALLVVFILIH